MEISSAYRNSRRNTSILCGIGIAWAAAQFEINTISLGALGSVNIEAASIPILISILCVYTISRCTIEFMMQPNEVRRWPLAKIDYQINLYLVRFTFIVLTAASFARTGKMVLYMGGAFLVLALGFFAVSFLLMFFIMPLRLFIRKLTGRTSVASAAIEATFYSFLFSGIAYIVIFTLIGFNVFNPFDYLGSEYRVMSGVHLVIFSCVCLVVLLSFFLDGKFLRMVFAYVPVMIESSYIDKDGREIFTVGPNPEPPDYENRKNESPMVYTKVDSRKETAPETNHGEKLSI